MAKEKDRKEMKKKLKERRKKMNYTTPKTLR
jgi:hypothetical protein